MRELSLVEVCRVAEILKKCVPDLQEVYIFGSASVAALHPELTGSLRYSVDVDMAPKGKPLYTSDSRFVENAAGQDSEFYDREGYFLDYVPAELLRVTPPGWEQRAVIREIAPGLIGHLLDSKDIACNKLWAGRAKDIAYVRDLLRAGVFSLCDLQQLHASNVTLSAEEKEKIDASLHAVATS
jgi:uncharacterized nucleotidyltransferase DUF6036